METMTIEVYQLKELSPEARSKALDNLRYINVDDDTWYEGEVDYFKTEKLAPLGYDDAVIAFSGFCSQGDGASFTASVDVVKWLTAHKAKTHFRKLIPLIEVGDLSASVKRIDRQYSHEYTVRGEVECGNDSLYALAQELEGQITEDVRQLSREIYKSLESSYDGEISDEAVADTIEANDYQFTENGSRTVCI